MTYNVLSNQSNKKHDIYLSIGIFYNEDRHVDKDVQFNNNIIIS